MNGKKKVKLQEIEAHNKAYEESKKPKIKRRLRKKKK